MAFPSKIPIQNVHEVLRNLKAHYFPCHFLHGIAICISPFLGLAWPKRAILMAPLQSFFMNFGKTIGLNHFWPKWPKCPDPPPGGRHRVAGFPNSKPTPHGCRQTVAWSRRLPFPIHSTPDGVSGAVRCSTPPHLCHAAKEAQGPEPRERVPPHCIKVCCHLQKTVHQYGCKPFRIFNDR